jgi:hypothetical protein
VRPAGDTVEVRLTVPVKPFSAVTEMIEVPELPAVIDTVVGLAESVNMGIVVVVKVAVWTVSGTGLGVPFATVTQIVVPDTLLSEHPVW